MNSKTDNAKSFLKEYSGKSFWNLSQRMGGRGTSAGTLYCSVRYTISENGVPKYAYEYHHCLANKDSWREFRKDMDGAKYHTGRPTTANIAEAIQQNEVTLF